MKTEHRVGRSARDMEMGEGVRMPDRYVLSAHFSAPNLSLQGPPRFPFLIPAPVSQHLCFPGQWSSGEEGTRKGSAYREREGRDET